MHRGIPLFVCRLILTLLLVLSRACIEVGEVVGLALLIDVLQLESNRHRWSPLNCILTYFIGLTSSVFLRVDLRLVGLQFV